jgi:two-component system cell cycle sensor histidine kinase/response regulator CckA
MKKAGLSTATRIVILIAFYVVGGLVGKQASFLSGSIELVWPPFGIALATILLFGYRYWPGVALGSVLFGLTSGNSFGIFTIGNAIGDTIGAVTCAYLLERFLKFHRDLSRVRDVAGLVGLASLLGTTVTAAFSVVSRCVSGAESWDNLAGKLLEWWVPNAMAGLIVTPLILAWGTKPRTPWKSSAWIEATLCVFGLVAGTLISFNSWYVYGIQTYPLAYLPYPFLVWGALRFGQRGATAGTFLLSTLAIRALLQGRGPFVMQMERDGLILIGCYLGILAITNMLLAAASIERETAVQAVSESQKRYRAIVEDQTELIWRFKEDGTVTFVNDAYCRFHGKSREELIGTKYLPMLSDEDRDIPLSYFAAMPPENPVISYDYRLVLPGGAISWQQCSTRRLFDEAGETLEFQSVAQDVTRRKQIEEDVREAEQRLRAILNTIVDALLVADASGLIATFNPAAEKIFAQRAADVTGRSLKELFAPEQAALFDEALSTNAKSGGIRVMEAAALRPDKSSVPIDLGISKVWVGGSPLLIVVVRDITERKRLEDQIRQAQKMEAVGRLAGGIAHDFNNLIQAVLGYTNLMLVRLPPADPNRDTVEQIEKAADRAASLTSQLLAFSRKQVLKPKVFCLNNSVADMTKLLQRLIGANIQLRTELADPIGFVRADPGQVEQVILNLCVNARDAMPQGGSLKLRTSSIDIPERLEGFSADFHGGRYSVLSVTDSGCGISPENRAKLFEPFFTTKELGKGTGLGLSIVYGIMKQSGGEIGVESELGKGTTFHIYLPEVEARPEEGGKQVTAAKKSTGGETVLLVEDGEIVRTMLVEVLQSNGYTVIESRDGEEALQRAAEHKGKLDILITDLVMPKISGRHLADKLHHTRPGLRVLFISGYTDDEVVRHGKLDANAEFLQKPFRPDALLVKVRSMLDASPKA